MHALLFFLTLALCHVATPAQSECLPEQRYRIADSLGPGIHEVEYFRIVGGDTVGKSRDTTYRASLEEAFHEILDSSRHVAIAHITYSLCPERSCLQCTWPCSVTVQVDSVIKGALTTTQSFKMGAGTVPEHKDYFQGLAGEPFLLYFDSLAQDPLPIAPPCLGLPMGYFIHAGALVNPSLAAGHSLTLSGYPPLTHISRMPTGGRSRTWGAQNPMSPFCREVDCRDPLGRKAE